MNKVYMIYPNQSCYAGITLIAANSIEEANEFIQDFKKRDKDNKNDSWGYSYAENLDLQDHLFSDIKGFIYQGIYYKG